MALCLPFRLLPQLLFWPLFYRSVTTLGTSQHSLIHVKIDAKPKVSPNFQFHRMIFQYAKDDWDNSPTAFLKKIKLPELFLSTLNGFLNSEFYLINKKWNSHPWFMPECAAASTITIYITGNSITELLLHSRQPIVSKRGFWKMQRIARHSQSKLKLKAKNLVPISFGKSNKILNKRQLLVIVMNLI